MNIEDPSREPQAPESEILAARLATIVANSDDAIISKTLAGYITSWNAGAARIFGYEAEEMVGQHISKIIPPNLMDEEKQIISRLTQGERIEHFETVRVAKDGRKVDISLTVSPMRDSGGRIIGASKVARDISDQKRAEETRRLLIDELNHRIKNTLATVQAIATQTLRRAETPSDFVTGFNGRITALARAHALLTGSSFQGAEITALVREQLLFGSEEDQRISWSGPTLTLEAQPALHMALILHELGTNARKHGALSQPEGRVDVSWALTNDRRSVQLHWREAGGPPVTPPTKQGFGSVLIESSLHAHDGEVTLTYAEGGLLCDISLPLPTSACVTVTQAPNTGQFSVTRANNSLQGRRILIVEDEPLIGMVLSDFLEDAGCQIVGPAQSAEKAKQMAAEEKIEGALVDGNLAGRPVDEIAAALRARRIPFAFVTGYGRDALPAGFDDVPIVEKPFTQEQVITTLERLLNTASVDG